MDHARDLCAPETLTARRSLKALRERASRNALSPAAQRILDEVDPDWRTPAAERRWRHNLVKTAAFHRTHNRPPRETRPDDPKFADEGQYGRWLGRQRRRVDLMPAWQRETLNQEVPDWDISRETDAYWHGRLREVSAWTDESGHLPRARGTNVSETEASHARWLQTSRAGRFLTPERIAALDLLLPGWNVTRLSESAWEQRMNEVVAWVRGTGRMPARRAADPIEARNGQWLDNNRRKTADPARQALLDTQLPGWR